MVADWQQMTKHLSSIAISSLRSPMTSDCEFTYTGSKIREIKGVTRPQRQRHG